MNPDNNMWSYHQHHSYQRIHLQQNNQQTNQHLCTLDILKMFHNHLNIKLFQFIEVVCCIEIKNMLK